MLRWCNLARAEQETSKNSEFTHTDPQEIDKPCSAGPEDCILDHKASAGRNSDALASLSAIFLFSGNRLMPFLFPILRSRCDSERGKGHEACLEVTVRDLQLRPLRFTSGRASFGTMAARVHKEADMRPWFAISIDCVEFSSALLNRSSNSCSHLLSSIHNARFPQHWRTSTHVCATRKTYTSGLR